MRRLCWPIRGLGVRRQVFVWSGVAPPLSGRERGQLRPIRGQQGDRLANQRTGICPVSSTVKLNAEMTEWRVLLQKNLNIKVAKTHTFGQSHLSVGCCQTTYVRLYQSFCIYSRILRTSWVIDGFVKNVMSILLIKVELTVLLINEHTNWNDSKGIDSSLSKIPKTGKKNL